jgi:hypothetical protein
MIYIHIQMISTDNTIRTLESTAVSGCFKKLVLSPICGPVASLLPQPS